MTMTVERLVELTGIRLKRMSVQKMIRKLILGIVLLTSLLTMLGHYIDNHILTGFGDDRVTMKFVTAYLFFLTAILMLKKTREWAVVIVTTGIYVFSGWFLNEAAPTFLPVFEEVASFSVKGDMPSIATVLSFLLLGINSFFQEKWIYKLVTMQGMVAIVGHIIQKPWMYFYFESLSTGEAVNTAALFVLIGLYKLLVKTNPKTN